MKKKITKNIKLPESFFKEPKISFPKWDNIKTQLDRTEDQLDKIEDQLDRIEEQLKTIADRQIVSIPWDSQGKNYKGPCPTEDNGGIRIWPSTVSNLKQGSLGRLDSKGKFFVPKEQKERWNSQPENISNGVITPQGFYDKWIKQWLSGFSVDGKYQITINGLLALKQDFLKMMSDFYDQADGANDLHVYTRIKK